MSGISSNQSCPVCGEEMSIYYDHKPHELVDGICLNCGFTYWTERDQMSLEEVNERRKEEDLKPIKASQLKKYKKEIKNL